LDDAAARELLDNGTVDEHESTCGPHIAAPPELSSNDPDLLRAALVREHDAYRRAQCLASMQAEVVQLALDLLVREPDVESFFAGLTKSMVEDSESHGCGVWLIDEGETSCSLWMAYVGDRLYRSRDGGIQSLPFPHQRFGDHLFAYKPGWTETIEYVSDDPRLPADVRAFHGAHHLDGTVVAPLVIGQRTLGWFKLSSCGEPECADTRWWRRVLTDAIARQAALALHFSRLVEQGRLEERRKAILEERNRLARDIHDNLAQGFGAILMQLQAAQRDGAALSTTASGRIETAIDLARRHLVEARRSVGTLRPNVGAGEAIATSLKRIADLAQRSTSVPIDVNLEELPRIGDTVEREIIGIAQEALTNAVRHARAKRITVHASAVRAIGVRLSVADDGRGFARDRNSTGFGMTSMQERAERIGASLTIVTAPRSGTEVVLAWEPRSLPTQVHVAS
jgi:signal transduction histidine kinase